MSDGWIKLWRDIMRKIKDPVVRGIFVDLLLEATHAEHVVVRRGHEITLNPGQLFLSRKAFSQDSGWSEKQIRRSLDILEQGQRISRDQGHLGTVVTICNWAKYQDTKKNRASSGPAHRASSGPAQGQPNNKEKKIKNESNKKDSVPSGLVELPFDNPTEPEMDFNFFWSCWRLPGAKRGSKARAESLYSGLVKSGEISHRDLCTHVERVQRFYETSGTPTSKQLHPATWLYQKRWRDELVIDQPQPRKSSYDIERADFIRRWTEELDAGAGDTPDVHVGEPDGFLQGFEPYRSEKPDACD